MKTDQELREYSKTHPGKTFSEMASNLRRHGVTTLDFKRALEGSIPAKVEIQGQHGAGKSIRILLDQFDDISKVRKAMKTLPKNEYLEDDELRRSLSIADTRWRSVRSHPSLSGFVFALPNKRTVWMHSEAQESLKAAIDLSSQ